MGIDPKALATLQKLADAQYLAECGKLGRIQSQIAAIDQGVRDAARPPQTSSADALFATGERTRWQDRQRRQLCAERDKLLPEYEAARLKTSRSLGRVKALEHLTEKAVQDMRRKAERADEVWVTLLTNLRPAKRRP